MGKATVTIGQGPWELPPQAGQSFSFLTAIGKRGRAADWKTSYLKGEKNSLYIVRLSSVHQPGMNDGITRMVYRDGLTT